MGGRVSTGWWGTFEVGVNETSSWSIGPLTVWIEGRTREWRISHLHSPDEIDRLAMTPSAASPDPTPALLRVATDDADPSVRLRPATADRPMVVRPDSALRLPKGGSTTFYMSTPAWVEILAAASSTELTAIPTTRPSDTWFGPSRVEGELCYASRTAARLVLEELPRRPGRISTEVRVDNRGADALVIERVQIPLPHLAVFAAGADLWTPSVTLTRRGDEPLAEVRVSERPPSAAGSATKVRDARDRGAPTISIRGLGAWLSGVR